MKTHDIGLWIKTEKWKNGYKHEQHYLPENFPVDDLISKNNAQITYYGKVIARMRNAKFFWIEHLPIIDSGHPSPCLVARKNGSLKDKLEESLEKIEAFEKVLKEIKKGIEGLLKSERASSSKK